MFGFKKKRNKNFLVDYYNGNNIFVIHHHDIKYVYTTVDKNNEAHKDFIELIRKEDLLNFFFIEYYEEIGREPEIRGILNIMKSYKDKYDGEFKLE